MSRNTSNKRENWVSSQTPAEFCYIPLVLQLLLIFWYDKVIVYSDSLVSAKTNCIPECHVWIRPTVIQLLNSSQQSPSGSHAIMSFGKRYSLQGNFMSLWQNIWCPYLDSTWHGKPEWANHTPGPTFSFYEIEFSLRSSSSIIIVVGWLTQSTQNKGSQSHPHRDVETLWYPF